MHSRFPAAKYSPSYVSTIPFGLAALLPWTAQAQTTVVVSRNKVDFPFGSWNVSESLPIPIGNEMHALNGIWYRRDGAVKECNIRRCWIRLLCHYSVCLLLFYQCESTLRATLVLCRSCMRIFFLLFGVCTIISVWRWLPICLHFFLLLSYFEFRYSRSRSVRDSFSRRIIDFSFNLHRNDARCHMEIGLSIFQFWICFFYFRDKMAPRSPMVAGKSFHLSASISCLYPQSVFNCPD